MQGYLLCLTPLKSEHPKFPLCNVPGKTEGKVPEMVVNSVCTTTLVHEKFVKSSALMGDKISVLTATGERLIVPLAWIGIESGQGKHAELCIDTGFVQSLEFLKKSGNLRTTFPDLEKVWKLKAKS